MKSTKNCSGTKSGKGTKACGKSASNCGGTKSCKGGKSKQESESDPLGSYTGNPIGWGKYSAPIQDVDDL